MAEMVLRPHRRKKVRMLDAPRRRLLPTREQVGRVLRLLGEGAPGFLLSMADLLGIPSGLYASYCTAMAALGRPYGKAMAGAVAAMALRWLCGMPPRWECLITLTVLLAAPFAVHRRTNPVLMGFTALAVLPTAVAGFMGSTALVMVTSAAAVPVSALSAPLFYRGIKALTESAADASRRMESMEERVCVGFVAAMLVCGGARLMLLGINLGALAASLIVLCAAMYLGVGAGCVAGMLAGVTLALQGLPVLLAVAFALGGFLAGILHTLGRRPLSCAAFLLGSLLPMLLSHTAGVGCGMAAAAGAAAGVLAPRGLYERGQRFFRLFLTSRATPGDAYAASMLSAWEKTVDAMALSVPLPGGREAPHDPAWWESKLCEGCPEITRCGCMHTELAAGKAETVWDCREADEPIWQSALEELRGLGCQRLYYLRQSMEYLRQEDAQERRSIRRAMDQRDMLVTHLTAMAGAARRFAMLSGGESWWDDVTARRIRRELSDAALPVQLSWVRRVQGHVQAAFELRFITGARKQAENLCVLAGNVVGAPMEVSRVDGDRVQIAEMPLLTAECGCASACIGVESEENCAPCGDTVWFGRLQDGRYMAALSDGMGHGERAALASQQTVELLRLCLDAGYTRAQTLTAVNGMMLLSGQGERFSTVDLLTVDLWSGQAALDKLGAAGSWLYQGGTLRQFTGDALPIGIIEHVECRECGLRLMDGDAVILLSDGVEEAFANRSELENAVRLSLNEASPEAAAHTLMQAALNAEGGCRRDDQTVAVIRLRSSGALQREEIGV